MFGQNTNAYNTPAATGIKIQTSAEGMCQSIVYGQCRVAGNLIWMGDFRSKKVDSEMGGSGFGGGGGGSGYTYKVSFMMAVCAGPINGIPYVWKGSKKKPFSKHKTFTLFTGSFSQAPWGYMTTKHPDQALPYPGICYVASAQAGLGSNAAIPAYNWEVAGLLQNVPGSLDCNPAEMVIDVATDPNHGADFPADRLDALSQYFDYCLAAGFLISTALDQQTEIRQTLADIINATNSAPVWTGGKLVIIPYGDEEISGNGRTFTPVTDAVYDLTDDDFERSDGAGPVKLVRKRRADAYNSVKLECLNRVKDYNVQVTDAKDSHLIETFGLRQEDVVQVHFFTDPAVARLAAQLRLQRQQLLNTYEFKLGWRFCLLDPMDIVTITNSALELDRQKVRITEIAEDETGRLSIKAEEFVDGMGSAPNYPTQDGTEGYNPDFDIEPGDANAPVIFEPPYKLTSGAEIWAVVSGAGEYWGGAQVWVSLDGETYTYVGDVQGKARQGVLTADFPAHSDPDTDDVLAVDLSMSAGELSSVTRAQCNKFKTLSLIGGSELVAYQTATLTGPNAYNLGTRIRRGIHYTGALAHAAGASFARLDTAVFKYAYDIALIGSPIYIKLASFNIWQGGLQDLSDVEPYAFTPTGESVQATWAVVYDDDDGKIVKDDDTGQTVYDPEDF